MTVAQPLAAEALLLRPSVLRLIPRLAEQGDGFRSLRQWIESTEVRAAACMPHHTMAVTTVLLVSVLERSEGGGGFVLRS